TGGARGVGQLYSGYLANAPNEPAVSSACGSNTGHRFYINVTGDPSPAPARESSSTASRSTEARITSSMDRVATQSRARPPSVGWTVSAPAASPQAGHSTT